MRDQFRMVLLVTAVAACGGSKADEFDEYKKKSMMSEARVKLNGVYRNASRVLIDEGAFPIGKVGPSPAEPCCKAEGKRCAPNPELGKEAIWDKLFFTFDEPLRFQYSYESTDGKTAIATAVGDLDCDGKAITFKLELAATESGEVKMNLAEPTVKDD